MISLSTVTRKSSNTNNYMDNKNSVYSYREDEAKSLNNFKFNK